METISNNFLWVSLDIRSFIVQIVLDTHLPCLPTATFTLDTFTKLGVPCLSLNREHEAILATKLLSKTKVAAEVNCSTMVMSRLARSSNGRHVICTCLPSII
jgi:hypothetical protein